MRLRILAEDDCRELLGMAEAIDVQGEAFALLAEGRSIEGLRSLAISERPPGAAIFNPAFLNDGGGYGIKVVSDFYDNEKKGIPRMSALVALFDGQTGLPRTIMEAGYLTDLRTGAGTGLGTRHLARGDSQTVTIFGAGRVARNQLQAICELCPVEKVLVATRTEARGRDFVARMTRNGGRVPKDIELVTSAAEAVDAADIVVCATTAHDPVFPGKTLRPGTFVVAAGAYEATTREVDSDTIRRAAKRVIDSRADSLAHAGDLVIPMREGVLAEADIAQISEVVSGQRPGRESDQEIIYYKSSGVPIQDLITAQHIERRAIERNLGTMIDIGGDHD